MRKPSEKVLSVRTPLPPILMGRSNLSTQSRLEIVLQIFLRVVAVVWMIEGVQHWMSVLTGAGALPFQGASSLHVAAVFFFCVLDFVAGVGLWLITGWGAAIWISTMAGQVIAAVAAPGLLPEPGLFLTIDAALLMLYGGLVWGVRRERRALAP